MEKSWKQSKWFYGVLGAAAGFLNGLFGAGGGVAYNEKELILHYRRFFHVRCKTVINFSDDSSSAISLSP